MRTPDSLPLLAEKRLIMKTLRGALILFILTFSVSGFAQPPPSARQKLEALEITFRPESFLEAAKRGNAETVKLFIEAGMDVNCRDANGKTALMKAAREGHGEIVKALAGKKVVLDTSGEGFRQAVAAGPWLIKPNADELGEFVGEKLETGDAIVQVARSLMQRHNIASVVVSMGKEGAIYVEGKETIWAVPPSVEVKSTVGAGDAMVAGTVAGKIRGLSLAECARLATAFSMTAISHIGSGLPSIAAVQSAQARVTIRDLSKA